MLSSRLALVLLGFGLLLPLRGDDPTSGASVSVTTTPTGTVTAAATAPLAFDLAKAFSADQVLTMKSGMSVSSKVFADNGKIREELDMNGMTMIAIGRTDEKKLYAILPDQKMIMEGPLPPQMLNDLSLVSAGADTKYEIIGPDVVDGTPCVKEKITASGGKVYLGWFNPITRVPVKLAADDGSMTVLMKNYQPGPQDAGLFEPPTGYTVVPLPENMAFPGMGQ